MTNILALNSQGCCCGDDDCCGIQPEQEAQIGFPTEINIARSQTTIGSITNCSFGGRSTDYDWYSESCWGGQYYRGRDSYFDAYGYRDTGAYGCYGMSDYAEFIEFGSTAPDSNTNCSTTCDPPCAGIYTQFVGVCDSGTDCLPSGCANQRPYISCPPSIFCEVGDEVACIAECADRCCCLSPTEVQEGDMSIDVQQLDCTDFLDTAYGTDAWTFGTISRNALADSIDHCGAVNQTTCADKYINIEIDNCTGSVCTNVITDCVSRCWCAPKAEGGNNCKCRSGTITLTINERGERVSSRQLVTGQFYIVASLGSTDWECYGGVNTVGSIFQAIDCDSDVCPICLPEQTEYGNAIEYFPHVFTLYGRGETTALLEKLQNNLNDGTWSYTKNRTWDGVTNVAVSPASIVVGESYQIQSVGTTNWVLCGAPRNVVGYCFTATATGTGTGTASLNGVTRANTLITGYTVTPSTDAWIGGTQYIPSFTQEEPPHSDPEATPVSTCSCDTLCLNAIMNLWLTDPTHGASAPARDFRAIPIYYARIQAEAYYQNTSMQETYHTTSSCGGVLVCDNVTTGCFDSFVGGGGDRHCEGSIISDYCAIVPNTTGAVMIAFWNANNTPTNISGTISWTISGS